VGADGLIRVTAAPPPTDVAMELWNADGSRAEMSGNGIRCLARAVVDARLVTGPDLVVQTDAGDRLVHVDGDGSASVDMGPAKVETGVGVADVDMGNPHTVVLLDDLAGLDLEEVAAAWPGRNVECVVAGPGPDELTMRVWERGVGETLACGTGACAAAAAAHGWGLVGEQVVVHQPGGDATVDIGVETLILTGPAQHVASVDVPWAGAAGSADVAWR
jgi:diaminopimelate epimerase